MDKIWHFKNLPAFTLIAITCWAQKNDSNDTGNLATCKNNDVDLQKFSASNRIQGWVDQPNFRGTFDIMWTCLVTIFISTYSMLYLNIPAPGDSFKRLFSRRILWMGIGILSLEFPLTYAADMGGFVFHARDGKPFPLNATQLHWLIINRFIEYPSVTRKEISYFVIQCIARVIQNVAITTLELNALAIVVCSLMTSYIWLHKPADVQTPVHLYSSHFLAKITRNRPWRLTPLDFVDENGPGNSMNVQAFMKMPVIPPNDRSTIHVAGWKLDFPTHIERLLWRTCSLLLFNITVAFWVFEMMASWTRLGRWKTLYLYIFDRKALQSHKRRIARRQMTMRREFTQLPLPWEFATILYLAIVYGIARFYLIGEAFAELRNMKGTAYVNVEWTNFIPHV